MVRKIAAELLGTGLLVYFGVGVATLSFGFGTAGFSFAAGVVGPALIVGGTALSQVWLFIVAPLAGGAVAAGLHRVLYPEPPVEPLASGELPV